MAPPKEVVSRIEEVRRRRGRKNLTYMKWDWSDLSAGVFCFLCKGRIKGLIEGEDPIRTSVIKGRTVVYKALIMANLPRYTEVKFEMDDGSFHVTSICRKCADRLTQQDMEDVYTSDLDQWWDDEKNGRGSPRWDIVGKRKPVRVIETAPLVT